MKNKCVFSPVPEGEMISVWKQSELTISWELGCEPVLSTECFWVGWKK